MVEAISQLPEPFNGVFGPHCHKSVCYASDSGSHTAWSEWTRVGDPGSCPLGKFRAEKREEHKLLSSPSLLPLLCALLLGTHSFLSLRGPGEGIKSPVLPQQLGDTP